MELLLLRNLVTVPNDKFARLRKEIRNDLFAVDFHIVEIIKIC